MPSPPITLYMTTIASQPALRQRQEYLFRILQVKRIPFNTYDLASDEEAKRLWRRKAPADKQQLPGILVGGKFVGTFAEFEDAVEHDELDIFLKLKEKWDPSIDEDRPPPEVKPVGIPGASSPLQMTPDHLKAKMFPQTPSPSPLKGKQVPVNKRIGELDMGDELSGYGLQGVKVTEDELRDLIAELGLDGPKESGHRASRGLNDIPTTTTAPVKGLKMIKKKPKETVSEEPTVKKDEAAEKAAELPIDDKEVKAEIPTNQAEKAIDGKEIKAEISTNQAEKEIDDKEIKAKISTKQAENVIDGQEIKAEIPTDQAEKVIDDKKTLDFEKHEDAKPETVVVKADELPEPAPAPEKDQ